MEWEELPANRRFKVVGPETHLQMEWSNPKGYEYRKKDASPQERFGDSLENFTEQLNGKIKDYMREDHFH
jgi:hypothetical protein